MLLPMFVHTLLTTTGSGIVGPVIMRDPPLFLGNDLLVTCIIVFFFLSVVFDPYVTNFIKTVSVAGGTDEPKITKRRVRR